MHIVVTGANGFIGRHLVKKLTTPPFPLPVTRLTVVDLALDRVDDHELIRKIPGRFAEAGVLASAFDDMPADLVFHLASVPSGLAESDYHLGVEVNVHGTMALLDKLKTRDNSPTVVFASSIAVYGKPAASEVNDVTLPTPNLSYGAQKVIGETLVADYARRQWIRGCSLRIPGIIARPPEPNGAVSIFFSDLIRSLSKGESFTCPVSSQAKSWLMSITCCVDNLVHAAGLVHDSCRTWTLPAMHCSIAELVDEIEELFPDFDIHSLISYDPDTWVEENFGSYPPLRCPAAEAAGFHNDGSLETLVVNALDGLN